VKTLRSLAACLPLLLGACSEPAQQAPAEPAAVGAAQCTRQDIDEPEQTQPFTALDATVVDQDGVPALVESVQVCGFDLCLVSDVAANGDVEFADELEMLGPAFKLGFGLSFAKFALRLSEPAVDFGTTVAIRLPPFEGAGALESSPTSNGVQLTLEPGTESKFDALTYRSTERGFRAVILAKSPRPHAVGPELDDAVVVALSPGETTFCPHAGLSVPNVEGWPAGAKLEFLLHGASIEQKFAPYGGWQVVSSGVVSADGQTLDTSDGEGLPALSAVAIRRSAP
jgi:hypothetical protein